MRVTMQNKDTFAANNFGKVSPWIDLVNSEEWDGFGNFVDRLEDPAWMPSFLRHWRFQPAPGEKTPLPALRALRTVLRGIAEKISAGGVPAAREIAQLNSAMNVPVRQVLVQRQNGYRTELQPLRLGWTSILSRIATSAAESIATGPDARIKIFANDDCRWAFRDPTKARTKRWCNNRTCGNRDRVRRSRAAAAR
jgi:predicted RNA-binding Zn ribbon-like protein